MADDSPQIVITDVSIHAPIPALPIRLHGAIPKHIDPSLCVCYTSFPTGRSVLNPIADNVRYFVGHLCCIRCGPGEERNLDIVPGGTELGTQVKTGSRAGRTHSQ